jgi:hypothetical protein
MVSEPKRGAPFDNAGDFGRVISADPPVRDCLEQVVAPRATEPVL